MPKPPRGAGTWSVQAATLRRQPGHGCGSGVQFELCFHTGRKIYIFSPRKCIDHNQTAHGRNFAETMEKNLQLRVHILKHACDIAATSSSERVEEYLYHSLGQDGIDGPCWLPATRSSAKRARLNFLCWNCHAIKSLYRWL